MRKTVSVAIVGLMFLSMFGLFGGVVEEVSGEISYDANTNTIFINNTDTYLSDIDSESSIPSNVFYYTAVNNTFHSTANLQINESANLIIIPSQKLKLFNSSETLYITAYGYLIFDGGNPLTPIIIDSDRVPAAPGDWGGIKFLSTNASKSIINFAHIGNASEAVYCDVSNPKITNSSIENNLKYGIYIKNSSPIIMRNIISFNGGSGLGEGGLYIDNSVLTVENCTVNNSPYNDYYLVGNANLTSLNSTFVSVNLNLPSTKITVQWYLDVLVRDNSSANPISGATVDIKEVGGTPVSGGPYVTDTSGFVRWIKVVEYIDTSSSPPVYYTPHNITVTHPEYYTDYARPEPNMNKSKQVAINLTMIRRDLTTNLANITFAPSGVPIAYEDLQITARIHNIEIDDAYNVRVIIEDEAPEGPYQVHNSTIGVIQGNTFKNSIDVWQPTPGTHTIWIRIDPYNEIREINSNPGIQAENNNNVSIPLGVNSRPWLNITEPYEDEEVKGTYLIFGDAFDNPDDAPNLPINDISRVDIRLVGHDWLNLFFPANIAWNGTPGGWDWFYSWNTTQWNGTPLPDGSYTLQARAWDNYHFSYIYEVNITVNNTEGNEPPVAVINEPLNNSFFSVNQTIKFNGSLSSDPNNDTLTYLWNFTDGSTAPGNVTYHAFTQKGTYNVSLTVNDTRAQDKAYVTVYVDNFPPYAEVTANKTNAYVNETILFIGYNSTDAETPELLQYFWDFNNRTDTDGDGNFTNDINFWSTYPIENATYAYNQSGTYIITLRVWDGRTNSSDTVIITINPNAAPSAVIDQPLTGQFIDVNETITFNASGSSDPNDQGLEYFWDFGDGTNSSWINTSKTTHYYSQKGPFPFYEFTVVLTVRDDEGLSDSVQVTISVNNLPPVAVAKSNVTTSPTLQNINFNGSDSYDPDQFTITSYLWDFADGNTSSQEIVDHQFSQNGVYNVTLRVTDTLGGNDTDWIIITITNRDPVINQVTTNPNSPKKNEQVMFTVTASDSDGTITMYKWNFGDGTSYQENLTDAPDGIFDGKTNHTYTIRSSYPVNVWVEDDDGAQNTTQFTLVIANSPPEITINNPTEGESVFSVVTIDGTSSDTDGSISRVEIRIDDGTWQITSGTDSWSYTWDTTSHYNGQHTIYARAYDGEDYTEPPASRNINISNTKTSITITEVLNPTSADQGGTVEVLGDAIYNTGEAVVGASVNITILDEPGSWITSTDSNGFYSLDITAPQTPGVYWVKVEVSKDSFKESTQVKLTVKEPPARPDLKISSSDILFSKSNPFSGDTIQITVAIRNIGDVDAFNVVVAAYYGDPDTSGKSISSTTVESVQAGSLNYTVLNWDTTGITGQYDVYIKLDPANLISESDETNNKASSPITISGRPDYAVTSEDITFSKKNPDVGEEISILIKIKNTGTESGTVIYKVYDGDPDVDGRLIDSGEELLSDDDETTLIVPWTPQESGEHQIFVELSPKGSTQDDDETNNKASSTITVKKVEEGGEFPVIVIIIVIAVVAVLLLFLFMNKRKKEGEKPQGDIPVATVIESGEGSSSSQDEEDKNLLDGQGGIRI